MSITTEHKPEDTTSKIAKLRKFHEPIFEALGVSDALYIPKMQYKPSGKDDNFIGLFENELKAGRDIYTERVSREWLSEDPDRRLYKWFFNPHWATEYEQVASKSSGYLRYLIPVAELVLIDKDSNKVAKTIIEHKSSKEVNLLDKPIGQLTFREFVAILTELVDPKPF